jgi:hypothetical protein
MGKVIQARFWGVFSSFAIAKAEKQVSVTNAN